MMEKREALIEYTGDALDSAGPSVWATFSAALILSVDLRP